MQHIYVRCHSRGLEAALRDHPAVSSQAHELCERYKRLHRKSNRVYTFETDPTVFFEGLEKAIGPPMANVFHAMQEEHDHSTDFEYYVR